MNSQPPPERSNLAFLAGILGALLLAACLVYAMKYYTRPAPLGEDRSLVRSRALAEIRGVEAEALHNVAWLDPAKGLVRLRIEDAMKMVERDWQNPPAARSNLIARAEKAYYVPPPPPNPFE